MKAAILGMGCVTPLGSEPRALLFRTACRWGEKPVEIANAETGRKHLGFTVDPEYTAEAAKEPRLRRSSAISLLAVTAARMALERSRFQLTPETRSRMAVVFAASSGGVQYTRRFYEQVVKQGANTASPMLFPETVYNAPASHVAAMLGVDGASYTLVGDATVGLQALQFSTQLLALGQADHVLLVGAEELDWILLEAHRDWRLTTMGSSRGALLADGAAALLLGRAPGHTVVETHPGHTYFCRSEAEAAMSAAIAPFAGEIDLLVTSANNTWTDGILEAAVQRHCPPPKQRLDPKRYLGEALGAGALIQVILAATGLAEVGAKRALVASLGWNQQAAAALVTRPR